MIENIIITIDTFLKKIKTFLYLICLFYLLFFFVNFCSAATLYLSPSGGTYRLGNTFPIAVKVNTNSTSINAAEGILLYDPEYLEVKDIKKGGSFTLWTIEPSVAPSSGRISFGGGVPNPGYSGSGGTILTITFKAIKIGTTQINFASGAVLANDGKGTNILDSKQGGSYNIQPKIEVVPPSPEKISLPAAPQINSLTHPDQNQWYNKTEAEFYWVLPKDITDVSFAFDQNPQTLPRDISAGLFDKKIVSNLTEGIWYFHLKFQNKEGWGITAHYKIQTDLTPPEPFEIKISEGNITTVSRPTLFFYAKDELSGISHYEIKIGEGDVFSLEPTLAFHNPYQLPYQAPGIHPIVVKAVDKAGNQQEAKTILLIKPTLFYKIVRKPLNKVKSIIFNYLLLIIASILILLLSVLLLLVLFKTRQKERRLKKEIKEVKESLEKGFEQLKKSTKKEKTKELEDIKKEIKKEIKDVEEEIE